MLAGSETNMGKCMESCTATTSSSTAALDSCETQKLLLPVQLEDLKRMLFPKKETIAKQ